MRPRALTLQDLRNGAIGFIVYRNPINPKGAAHAVTFRGDLGSVWLLGQSWTPLLGEHLAAAHRIGASESDAFALADALEVGE